MISKIRHCSKKMQDSLISTGLDYGKVILAEMKTSLRLRIVIDFKKSILL